MRKILTAIFLATAAGGLGAATAPKKAVKAPETVTIPADFAVESLRGLELADGADGVTVVHGNGSYEDGSVIISVNGQSIRTGRELMMLANVAWAAGKLTVSSKGPTPPPSAAAQAKPKFSNAEWAQSLIYADTPAGVIVEFSLDEEEIGRFLTAINDQPISNSADARRLLAEIGQGNSFSKAFKWNGTPGSDVLKADGPLELVVTNPATIAPPRLFFLDRAVAAEPSRPTAAATEEYARSWGALASLAGQIFTHQNQGPAGTCERNESWNSCFALVWWQVPGQALARYWFADRGYLLAADLVTPTDHPGLFNVWRWTIQPSGRDLQFVGPQQSYLRASSGHVREGGKTAKLAISQVDPQYAALSDGPTLVRLEDLVSRTGFQSYSRATAVKYSKDIVANVQRSIEADKRAQRERSRSEAMAGIYGALTGIGQALDQQNQMQREQFNQQLAEIQRANGGAGGQGNQTGASSGGSSGAIVLGSSGARAPEPSVTAPAAAPQAVASTYHWYCYGQTKQRSTTESDRIVAIYYGTVTSSREDINGATALFRQHTSSDQASDTENPGAWCAPAASSAEANERLRVFISRDASGGWRQVTGINLTM